MIVRKGCLPKVVKSFTKQGSYFVGFPALYKDLHITLHSLMYLSARE